MISRNKTIATAITTILVLSMVLTIFAVPSAMAYNAATQAAINQGMYWVGMSSDASANRLLLWSRFQDKIPTWCFLAPAPNPVGVGQPFTIVMFNPQVPPNSLLTNDIRYQFTIDVVKPDNSTESLPPAGVSTGNVNVGGIQNGKYLSDSTGSAYTTYTPTMTGNYTFTLHFQELFYRWNSSISGGSNDYYGTTFLASNYKLTEVVQDAPVSLVDPPLLEGTPSYYWTRPVEGQNTAWYTVASNWLSGAHDRDNYAGSENRFQQDGIAPNSPHILWTKPTEDNGVVGGNLSRPGNVFNAGSQYQPRFTNQIIMYGRLYYSPNYLTSGSSAFMDCVDLKTGKLLYEVDTAGEQVTGLLGVSQTANMPQFGYYYSQDDPNEHGIQNPGWLFTNNYALGFQPERGTAYLQIANVPAASFFGGGPASVFEVLGPQGQNIRYVITNQGNTTKPNYYIAQWNSSKVIPMIGAGSNPTNQLIYGNVPITPARPGSQTWNGTGWSTRPSNATYASVSSPSYDWNMTLPWNFTTTPTIRAVKLNDMIFGTNGSWPTGTSGPSYYYPNEVTFWAVSLKPGQEGQMLYMQNVDIEEETKNENIMFERASVDTGIVAAIKVPSCTFIAYDIRSGTKLWEGDAQADTNAYGYFTWPSLISQTQTKMAYGILYTAGYTGFVSAYNATNGNLIWRRTYVSGGEKIQNFVQMIALICDNKIYVGTHEHSADTPLYKGEKVHCLNALTGDEVWTLDGWAYPMTFATADGVLIYWNNYDAQVYAIGKGPTSTTVSAPDANVEVGKSIVIHGSVMDVSAGTQQQEQAARFPNGVPAVSDASMAGWMEYVYEQKGFPTNCTGVEVSINVLDANNNYREIGKATTDASGYYSLAWKPDIPGKYNVVAVFAGSESFYSSNAESAFVADAAPAAPVTPETPVDNTPTMITYAAIGIIAAIAIVGIILALLVLRKH